MTLTRTHFLTAVALSLAVHFVGAAIFTEPRGSIEVAGGAATSELVLGTAFNDSLMAGTPTEALQPVEALSAVQPVEASVANAVTVEAANSGTESQISNSIEPAQTENLLAANETPAETVMSPLIEAVPVRSEELSASLATTAIAPVPEPQLALPDNIPVPAPRPERAENRASKTKAAASDRQKTRAPRPKPRISSSAKRDTPRASSNRSSAGDGGRQKATTSKSSSGTAAAKRTKASGNAAISNYPGKVASKLRRALRFPREARRQRLKGDVVVSFVVAGNGGVSSIRIARSSGVAILDEAAREAVRRAAPFPPIPREAGRKSWRFSVPLGFTR
ncbi:energy transducer TonB [Pseudohoeflea coraliihabitans]|uniref:Energy transducer TonB n=1 Tax=Pseudohoeflea coraliihabitans TaxID=2860393 RepID=A0ABS6WP23_9HYPH|nr:energy transducer TonB [Pseudohoeflea sp. DP4N28-3]MBW3097716.1 energy transducer TonB [Pseudohoeflea sp. DP4N28-3]